MHGNGFFNSGLLDSDATVAAADQHPGHASRQPGTFAYICLIHPFMKGEVTVTP